MALTTNSPHCLPLLFSQPNQPKTAKSQSSRKIKNISKQIFDFDVHSFRTPAVQWQRCNQNSEIQCKSNK